MFHPNVTNCQCESCQFCRSLSDRCWQGIKEAGCKFDADMMMCGREPQIIIPTETVWVGLNLLERDDELKRGK